MFLRSGLDRRSAWPAQWGFRLGLSVLPHLANVLCEGMAFVGPRPLSVCDALLDDPRLDQARFAARQSVPPGLICVHWLRRRANIDYESELDADLQYVARRSLKGDLSIGLRALLVLFWFGSVEQQHSREVTILGLRIDNISMAQALEEILRRASRATPSQVCCVNADCANIAFRSEEYRRVLQAAPLVLADGIGMRLAGKLLRRPIRQNVNGTDLFPRLCEAAEKTGHGIFLLGARPGLTEKVRDWVAERYPRCDIRGCRHGYFTEDEEEEVVAEIAASRAEILLVAFGTPRQDLWISRYLAASGAKVALGVGGLFDYYSGHVSRAPQWVRELSLEWFYRVCQEPGRLWRRYFLGNGLFLWRVACEKVFGSIVGEA
jgi:N-acetylglucosaminyldiphosphoundecaprenol N-acetyl-beta-D-mannosaminyltransferase